MGFRYRKSINFKSGFRVNLSKSGVGYSWGIPGYRITKTAKGNMRRTISIPGTGISHVEERQGKDRKKHNGYPNQQSNNGIIMENVNSADIANYQPVQYKELLNKIKRNIILNTLSNLMIFTIILASNPIFFFTLVIGILLKIYGRIMGKVILNYELDEFSNIKHKNMIDAWRGLGKSDKIWQITQSGKTKNRKINAGATSLVARMPLKIKYGTPYYIGTNVDIVQLVLKKETLIFLPDKVLIIEGIKVGAVDYEDIKIFIEDVDFVEDGAVPRDSTIVGYTWEKVNKDGSPDKRYGTNRQLPICKYGLISISSYSGLNILVHSSSTDKAMLFKDLILD